MAQATHHSPKEFMLGFIAEDTVGTAETPGTTNKVQLINIDSVSAPSLNTEMVADVRSGDGRTAKASDVYVNNKLQKREISFSGIADYNTLPKLLQGVMSVAEDGTDRYDIPYNYSPPDLKHGTVCVNASATPPIDFSNQYTFTVFLISPETSGTLIFPGCTVESLTISGDMGTESGRMKMEGSFVTSYKPTLTGGADVGSTKRNSYSTNYYYLTDMETHTLCSVSDVVMSSFSCAVENPTEYMGFQGANPDPEVIARAIPEISASWEASFKYDSDSKDLFNTYESGTNAPLTLTDSGGNISFSAGNGRLTSVSLDEGAAMFVSVGVKVLAPASGDMLQITAKDA
jgi:hypothetical protein